MEGWRRVVASLTTSTYEELVAVSIDALERDFINANASGASRACGRSAANLVTGCSPGERSEGIHHFGSIAFFKGGWTLARLYDTPLSSINT